MLDRDFGPLSKTLFFEYQTIEQLAEYFVRHHGRRLSGLLELKAVHRPVAPAVAALPKAAAVRHGRHRLVAAMPCGAAEQRRLTSPLSG